MLMSLELNRSFVWNMIKLGMTHIIKPLIFLFLQASIRTVSLAFSESAETSITSIENKNVDNNMTKFNEYLEEFFARNNTLDVDEWITCLPDLKEKEEMTALITELWDYESSDNYTANVLDKYIHLRSIINVTRLNDILVIHEKPNLNRNLRRYWGYMALRTKKSTKRNIHHSAPHFESDGDVCREAAYIFENTLSRSLVVAGASRFAVRGNISSSCQSNFQIADAAHNCDHMFHHWNIVISNLSLNTNSIFVQWHGMAETSCENDVFISTGTKKNKIYQNNIPAVIIRNSFNEIQTQMKSTTPDIDACRLTAGSNVFGRYLNGVPSLNVCNTSATIENIHGIFVHIEQKRQARDALKLWGDVIRHAYATDDESSSNRTTS